MISLGKCLTRRNAIKTLYQNAIKIRVPVFGNIVLHTLSWKTLEPENSPNCTSAGNPPNGIQAPKFSILEIPPNPSTARNPPNTFQAPRFSIGEVLGISFMKCIKILQIRPRREILQIFPGSKVFRRQGFQAPRFSGSKVFSSKVFRLQGFQPPKFSNLRYMTKAGELQELRSKWQAHGKRRGVPCRILQNPCKNNTI